MDKKIRKLLQYEYCLNNIADSFRTSDTSFKLDLEYNSLLNDIGKILEDICFILRKYRYVQEEKKIVIRRTAHKIMYQSSYRRRDSKISEVKND